MPQNNIITTQPIVNSKNPNVIQSPNKNIIPSKVLESESMPQDDSQSRFLASLLSQGAGMFGAALQGENVMKAGQVFESNRDYQNKLNEQKKQIESLTNPESDVSKRKRLVYERALGIKIPGEFSASDLEDRNVLQGLVAQSQPKPVPGRVGGGVSQPKETKSKEEKEKPSEKKLLSEYTEHARSLQSSINVMDAVRNLNRSPIGRFTPDISTKTKADVGTIDREAQPQVKVLAGPGSVTDSERQAFIQLVTNSNMTRELAEETTKRTVIEGTSKAMAKLKADRDVGLISDSDFNKIINQYNQYLKNPKLGINKEINQDGDIVDIGSIDFNEE